MIKSYLKYNKYKNLILTYSVDIIYNNCMNLQISKEAVCNLSYEDIHEDIEYYYSIHLN